MVIKFFDKFQSKFFIIAINRYSNDDSSETIKVKISQHIKNNLHYLYEPTNFDASVYCGY